MKFVPEDPIHPGEILSRDFMDEFNLTTSQLASNIGVSIAEVKALQAGNSHVTAEMALRLSRHFSNSPEFWLNLQRAYDLSLAMKSAKDLDAIRPVQAA
jgi:antitoxin HigA-1